MKKSIIKIYVALSCLIFGGFIDSCISQVNVAIPDYSTRADTSVIMPIIIGDISNYDIISYQFHVKYDSTVIRAIGLSVENSITDGWGSVFANVDTPGLVIAASFGTASLPAGDTLINLNFQIIGKPGDSTEIILEDFKFNNGNPQVSIKNGNLKIKMPASINNSEHQVMPGDMSLIRNYPDPFTHGTNIIIENLNCDFVDVSIVNILGQIVKNFRYNVTANRKVVISWSGRNNNDQIVSPGVYFCLISDKQRLVGKEKMVFIQ